MKAELLYVTDPYCVWCYGFGKVVGRAARDYADKIDVRIINGGMIPSDTSLATMFGRFPDPMALHERTASTSGQPFGQPYLDEIRRFRESKLTLNSNTPARALVAFRLLGVEDEFAVTAAIQQAYYGEARDLQDVATYEHIAAQFGVDFAAFKSKFEASETAKSVADDRRIVEQMRVQGFPAVIFRGSEDRLVQIASGFLPYANFKTNLDTALSQYWSAPEAQGQSCSLDGAGC